ncbi:MAG: RagB/SusD family nutrient uptake outer membrane protein, partial [Duncaniella sp.]|nr:RagB/SusD family nutrient uptake outer membrane protein [Duncaniella sp.]
MKIAYNIKAFATASLLGLSLASCTDWLKVDMNDQVMENTLYTNYSGFRAALNGVYLGMNDLYTTHLGAGAIDVMAQYYYVTENDNHSMRMYSGYKYNDAGFESINSNIWSSLYTLLANTNVLLEHTDDDAAVLTPEQRGLIRGEALALRAFFHFDLLRLYGPIYSQTPDEVCIPFQGSSRREIQPLLPASEVIGLIIDDLKEAEALLREYDPIITSGVGNVIMVDDGTSAYDSSYRQIRLNYYAVEAMLARAYLWKGDRAE